MLTSLILTLAAAAISAVIISWLINHAERLGLVQAPEARSSHVRPTPTGGGIGIVIAAVSTGLALAGGEDTLTIVLMLSALMALLGLIDDRSPLPARVRFAIQAALMAALIGVTDASSILAGDDQDLVQIVAAAALLLAGLWWVNLFNFMDGIDGIAGQQSVLMIGSALVISATAAPSAAGHDLWWIMAATLAATAAFLAYNWPPARIFMGDAGSTFLGFAIFAFALITVTLGWLTVAQWLVLAALFAVDATVTLVTRYLRGERVTQAHRSHAYQRLSRRLGNALPVSAAAVAINVLVLFPIALLLPAEGLLSYGIVVLVYVLVAACTIAAGAGLRDNESWSAIRSRGTER